MLDELNTFICVAHSGSFRKAGELMYLSSNAVKKRIGLLESRLGFPLFMRTTKGVSLTPAGRCLLRDAKQIVHGFDEAVVRARQAARGGDILRIGMMDTFADQFLMADWSDVRSTLNGKIQLTFFGSANSGLSTMLENIGNEIDMAVDVYDRQLAKRFCLAAVKISDLKILCGMSPQCMDSMGQPLSLCHLEGKTIVLLQKGRSLAWDQIRAFLHRSCPSAVIEDVPVHSVKMFGEYDGADRIFLMTQDWKHLYPFLHFVPCAEDFSIPFGIYYPQNPSEQIQRSIQTILRSGHSKSKGL